MAKNNAKLTLRKGVIFVDEIHRFSKAQQDVFLPFVERGDVTLIAATTENPSFRVNSALLSRCRVFVLEKLDPATVLAILERARSIKQQGSISDELLGVLAKMCDGDARVALNSLEMALDASAVHQTPVSKESLSNALQKSHTLYDKDAEEHYNCISALHKSMRGSADSAALYWLGKMLYAGEDPLYIARRLVRFASEDVGMADSNAIQVATACYSACQMIGMPECDVILAHCVTYLSRAPKCVSVYQAMKKVKRLIESSPSLPVPLHLRNAPTELMKDLDYGKDYKYPPNYTKPVDQDYFPLGCPETDFFTFRPSHT